jgi:hypothetical protein
VTGVKLPTRVVGKLLVGPPVPGMGGQRGEQDRCARPAASSRRTRTLEFRSPHPGSRPRRIGPAPCRVDRRCACCKVDAATGGIGDHEPNGSCGKAWAFAIAGARLDSAKEQATLAQRKPGSVAKRPSRQEWGVGHGVSSQVCRWLCRLFRRDACGAPGRRRWQPNPGSLLSRGGRRNLRLRKQVFGPA